MNKTNRYKAQLNQLQASGNLRQLRHIRQQGGRITYQGWEMLNLSSNDYLGLSADARLWEDFLATEAVRASGSFPGGACSSRLLTGNHPAYDILENTLARMYGAEAALVFNTGYHANMGILPALTTSNDLILADKLVHASIIDGIRLSPAKCIRFPHNDLERLERILEKDRAAYDHVFIVTESVFSMDGDRSDLKKLVEIKERYDAFLYVDEAHALGVMGPTGLGCAEELGLLPQVDFLVGTFGKAIASQGAYVVCRQLFRDYLINTMRPLIFTTGLPAWSVLWTNYVMERLPQMAARRNHLYRISARLRSGLAELGFETGGDSQIVPVIIHDLVRTLKLSEALCQKGFFVLPIRTPTVPAGTERLRISLTAAITEEQIDQFLEVCKHIGK